MSLLQSEQISVQGKLDTNLAEEERTVAEIKRALHSLHADAYLCTYGDDPAGDLVLKFENGNKAQVVTIEAHSWPDAVFERVTSELSI
jgi:hypothetical protein